MTLHATLSLEQGLGSTVQYGHQSWAQCRAQWPVTPTPSCPRWQGVDATSVLSVTPLHCVVVWLTSWEWLVALVRHDIPVEVAVMGQLPSRPRARRRIGTSSEALRGGALGEGASGEARSWYLIRGLAAWALGGSENRPRPRGCLLASIFTRSKQFFRFLLRVPLFMVSDNSSRASGGVRALSLRF